MILLSLFDISTSFRFPKNLKSCTVHIYSRPCSSAVIDKCLSDFKLQNKQMNQSSANKVHGKDVSKSKTVVVWLFWSQFGKFTNFAALPVSNTANSAHKIL